MCHVLNTSLYNLVCLSNIEMAIGAGIGASSVAAFVLLAGGGYFIAKRIRKKR